MSSITKKDLDILAKSAKIKISEEEYEPAIDNINDILQYVDILYSISDEDVEHLKKFESTQTINHFREDVTPKTNNSDAILECCPEVKDRQIVVPSIIKK